MGGCCAKDETGKRDSQHRNHQDLSSLHDLSCQSTLKMLLYMLLLCLKVYNKNHSNEDLKEEESWAWGNRTSVLSSDLGCSKIISKPIWLNLETLIKEITTWQDLWEYSIYIKLRNTQWKSAFGNILCTLPGVFPLNLIPYVWNEKMKIYEYLSITDVIVHSNILRVVVKSMGSDIDDHQRTLPTTAIMCCRNDLIK